MKMHLVQVVTLLALTTFAGERKHPPAKVSFSDYKDLMAEVEPHRAARLVDLDTFLKMSRQDGTIILDSRSDFRFDRIHIKGARHLAFTDFTQENLAKMIPDPDTRILIYCNNNFDGNPTDFASKVFVPRPGAGGNVASQLAAQEKPRMLALNIPTYLNLYGYGYRNVYELDELVRVTDPRIAFGGSLMGPSAGLPLPPASK